MAVINSIAHSSAARAVDRYLTKCAFFVGKKSEPLSDGDILLLTPGGHNVGDQAMYEAVCENLPTLGCVVCPSVGGFDYRVSGGCRVLELPHLLARPSLRKLLEVYRFSREVRRGRRLIILGADVMDGGYSEDSSRRTWELAMSASTSGLKVSVVGFSWGQSAAGAVAEVARRAVERGVDAKLRDPVSFRRFTRIVGNGSQVADVVFGGTATDASSWLAREAQALRLATGRLAIVNLSALVAERIDQIDDYKEITGWLIRRGYAVLVVPHVANPASNDLAEVAKLRVAMPANLPIRYLSELMSPAMTRGVLQHVDVVVTGRMHLAVLALAASIPSVVMSTQGKVEGLLEYFGHPEWCIEPEEGFGKRVIEVLCSVDESLEVERDRLSSAAHEVSDLSRQNW